MGESAKVFWNQGRLNSTPPDIEERRCSLTRRGDTSDGPTGLLRDLEEMSNRRTKKKPGASTADFIAARRRAHIELMLPADPKIAFSGRRDLKRPSLFWHSRI